MKIVHLPTYVGMNAWNLSKGERRLGYQSKVIVTETHIIAGKCYDEALDLPIGKNIFDVFKFYVNFFVKAIREYDVFHYNFGRSLFSNVRKFTFLRYLEFMLLKLFKKVVCVTYQGSDARQTSYCLNHHKITYFLNEDREKNEENDRNKVRNIALFDKYADRIYTTQPDLMPVLPERTKFRPLTKLQIEDFVPFYSDYNKELLNIVHAPSKRSVKGTDIVLGAINRLIDEKHPVHLLLVENTPNSEALEIYKDADIVIDQVLAGWYGGFAVECMAMGKPVAVYIRDEDMKYIPKEMFLDLPFIKITPDTIYEVLKAHIENRELLKQKAIKSREYVLKWHDSVKIAEGIVGDYIETLKLKGKSKMRNRSNGQT